MYSRIPLCIHILCALAVNGASSLVAQDTTPPALVSTLPADNAQNVPLNTAVSFTFSEPMAFAYSVNWSADLPNRTRYWTADQRTIIFLFYSALPTNTLVTWELNPVGTGTGFRDLAGNQLPLGVYHGSFTTGTNATTLELQSPALTVSNQFRFSIVGSAGHEVIVYGSTNLNQWVSLQTNAPSPDPIDFLEPTTPASSQRLYKAASILPPQ